MTSSGHHHNNGAESTPICRCRVLYLGSSVPQQTKDGLQGIQEPLQELYPEEGGAGARGIDSWLSVWSNGILLENVDENHKKITRFFPIESLHYCAAVRYVLVPEKNTLHSPSARFLPLDSPFARAPNPLHPPLFAAILRRTTGIKVLECHAFVCKREVAANALVRCCFHAYADSSYAKQVDTAGSIYGTLATERVNNGREGAGSALGREEWKMSRSRSGSTMTIDTVDGGAAKDDVSVYNGDENHKVWAGSQDNLLAADGSAIYDAYSATSTMGRPSSRPRQMTAPLAVVAPPPPPSGTATMAKEKKSKGKSKKQQQQQQQHYNGSLLRPTRAPPLYVVATPQPPPPPSFFRHHNTYSHRPRHQKVAVARPMPIPVLVPQMGATLRPPPPPPPQQPHTRTRTNGRVMEEPIYMPSNRALSPVASYQPVNFPHEAYLMQHYATMDPTAHCHLHQQQQQLVVNGKRATKNGKPTKNGSNRALAQAHSMVNLSGDDPNAGVHNEEQNNDESGSPFNTGIYRKKGHLNERAFSYSIRQEHRSRSYGSLANLKFASPIPNGEAEEDLKKEREIMQMVHDLDLSGDDLERSEVPRQMYDVGRGGLAGTNGAAILVASTPHHVVNGRSSRKY